MITTKEKRDEFISKGSEIEGDLLDIFSKNSPIVIADIGACDGLSTIIYSKIFPEARHYTFEPVPENYKAMCENFVDYGIEKRVECYNAAVSNRIGVEAMYLSSGQAPGIDGWNTGNTSSSILRPKKHLDEHKWCEFNQILPVKTVALDSLILPAFDFVHLDVQGAEMKALLGGKNHFKRTTAMWVEVANVELYFGQPLRHNILSFLGTLGFRVIKDTCGKKKWGDILCIKK